MAPASSSCDVAAAPLYDALAVMDEGIGHHLANLMHLMRREIELRMVAHGLTGAQWKPLWLLKSGRAATPQELSRCTVSDAGAMTRLLDRLVAKGLIERERSDTDRRVVQLRLTAAGEDAAAQVPQVLAEVNQLFLQGVSPAEWTQLRGLLTRMAANGQALADGRESGDDNSHGSDHDNDGDKPPQESKGAQR